MKILYYYAYVTCNKHLFLILPAEKKISILIEITIQNFIEMTLKKTFLKILKVLIIFYQMLNFNEQIKNISIILMLNVNGQKAAMKLTMRKSCFKNIFNTSFKKGSFLIVFVCLFVLFRINA